VLEGVIVVVGGVLTFALTSWACSLSWLDLASRFRSNADVEGTGFESTVVKIGGMPYRGASVIIGDLGIALQFPILLPRMFIPWTSVRSCTPRKGFLMNFVTLELLDGASSVEVSGKVASAVEQAWADLPARIVLEAPR
jgi:hypothetical protein